MPNDGQTQELCDRSHHTNSIQVTSDLAHPESLEADEEPTRVKFTFRQWLTLFCLAFGNFSIGSCVSLQAPFFPAEAERKGATATEYGFVFGVYQLTMFLCAPIFGKMVAFVTPYFTLNSGVFVVGVATILFGLLDHSPPGATFVSLAIVTRIVEGLGAIAVKLSTYTIISIQFQDNVATAFASMETCLGVGLILGPTVGGALYQVGGYPVPFMVSGILLLLDALIIFFIMPKEEGKFEKSGNLLKFWANPVVILSSVIVFTSYYYIGVYQSSLEPHLRQFNLSPFWIGMIFIVSGGVYSISAPLWGRLCDKGANLRIIAIAGCVFVFLSELLIGPAPFIHIDTKMWMVVLATTLMGLGLGAKQVSAFILCIRNAIERDFPNDITTYGLVSSMFLSSQSLGAFIGPILGGYLLDTWSFRESTVILMTIECLLMVSVIGLVTFHFCQSRDEMTQGLLQKQKSASRKRFQFETSYSQIVS